MAALSEFLPYILPMVPGCSEPMAEQAIRRVARTFCRLTDIVQFTTDPIDIKTGVATYEMDIPAGTEILSFRDAWVGTRPLKFVGTFSANTPFAQIDMVAGKKAPLNDPVEVFIRLPGTVVLYPTPKADLAKGLTVTLSLQPTLSADTIPDILANDWIEAIANGAVSRLASMPKQPFTDPAVAADASSIYSGYVGLAKLETWKGRGMADQQVTMRPLA